MSKRQLNKSINSAISEARRLQLPGSPYLSKRTFTVTNRGARTFAGWRKEVPWSRKRKLKCKRRAVSRMKKIFSHNGRHNAH